MFNGANAEQQNELPTPPPSPISRNYPVPIPDLPHFHQPQFLQNSAPLLLAGNTVTSMSDQFYPFGRPENPRAPPPSIKNEESRCQSTCDEDVADFEEPIEEYPVHVTSRKLLLIQRFRRQNNATKYLVLVVTIASLAALFVLIIILVFL